MKHRLLLPHADLDDVGGGGQSATKPGLPLAAVMAAVMVAC